MPPVERSWRFSAPLCTPPDDPVEKASEAELILVALGIVPPFVARPCQEPVVGVTQTLVFAILAKFSV